MRLGRVTVGPQTASALLLLIGAVLLATTFVFSWYTISATNGTQSVSESFYIGGVHGSISGLGSSDGSYLSSYSDAHLPHTGGLFTAVTALVATGVVVGLAGGALLLRGRRGAYPRAGLIISILATVLVASAPVVLLAEQPPTVCADAWNFSPPLGGPASGYAAPACTWEFYLGGGGWSNPVGVVGPGSTFVGETSQSGWHQTWGPELAWFLALLAFAMMFAGTLIAARTVRRVGQSIAFSRTPSAGSLSTSGPPQSHTP